MSSLKRWRTISIRIWIPSRDKIIWMLLTTPAITSNPNGFAFLSQGSKEWLGIFGSFNLYKIHGDGAQSIIGIFGSWRLMKGTCSFWQVHGTDGRVMWQPFWKVFTRVEIISIEEIRHHDEVPSLTNFISYLSAIYVSFWIISLHSKTPQRLCSLWRIEDCSLLYCLLLRCTVAQGMVNLYENRIKHWNITLDVKPGVMNRPGPDGGREGQPPRAPYSKGPHPQVHVEYRD